MTLLVKNIQYFHVEVEPDRLDELGDWQTAVDMDFEIGDFEQVSDDYYEFVEVVKND